MENITFINAGAGSGKTFSLTLKLADDIKKGKYNANEILLTTFTKKAAEEIKIKARSKMLEEGLHEQAILLQDAYMGTVHSVGYQFMKKYWYKLGLSPEIREMGSEDVEVYFNQAIANVPEEQELDKLATFYEKFDFVKWEDNFSKPHPFQWKDHVKEVIDLAFTNTLSPEDLDKDKISYEKSLDLYREIFKPKKQLKTFSDTQLLDEIKYLVTMVKQLPEQGNGGRIKKARELEKKIFKTISYSTILEAVDLAVDSTSKKTSILSDDNRIGEFLVNASRFYYSENFMKDVEEYIGMIFSLARRSMEKFIKFKEDHALVDFNDMERKFLELISDHNDIKDDLKNSVRIVMVDEFQDSNPIQLSIFLKLAEIVEENVWVGDPKQAIYSFRGTDPDLVNALFDKISLAEENSGLQAQLLKRSWRSRPDLVNLANRLFEPKLKDQLAAMNIKKENLLGFSEKEKDTDFYKWANQLFKDQSSITLTPEQTIGLIPQRNADEGLNEKAIQHWHFDNDKRGQGNDDDWAKYLAVSVKEWIKKDRFVVDKHTRKKRQMIPADVAILVRTNSKLSKVVKALLNEGLEVSAEGDDLSMTAEYRILLNMLELLVNPTNSLAITELMLLIPDKSRKQINTKELISERIQFVKDIDEQVSSIPETKERNAKYFELLNNWGQNHPLFNLLDKFKEEARHLSVPALLEKLIVTLNVYEKVQAFSDPGQRTANLQQILKYANEYGDHCIRLNKAETLTGFVDYLKNTPDKDKQAASRNPNAVNVLTTHKAKGLEWPVVILYELTNDFANNFLAKTLFKTRIKSNENADIEKPLMGRYIRFAFWPFGSKKTLDEDFSAEVQELPAYLEAMKAAEQEALRLIYVGVTRARDYMITTSFKKKEATWYNMIMPDDLTFEDQAQKITAAKMDFDLYGLEIMAQCEYKKFDEEESDEQQKEVLTTHSKGEYFPKSGYTQQRTPLYLSPSKEKGDLNSDVIELDRISERIKPLSSLEDNVLGDVMHNLLYLMNDQNIRERIPELLKRHRAIGKLDTEEILQVVEGVKKFVKSKDPVNVYHELALIAPKDNGQYFKGEADLVIERENDLILIDYKTYQGSREQILTPPKKSDNNDKSFYAGKYAPQLKAYKQMLEHLFPGKKVIQCLIFYVMQGLVVEVKV